jgi:hypothetical protein
MILTISLFFFGISLAFAMIARKIWQFRTARIVPGSYEEADWTDLSIGSIRMRLIDIAKFGVHHFVLLMLKAWILVSNWIRITDRKIKVKLTHLLHRNGHLPEVGSPSEFLTVMHAHKEEIATAMEKEGSEEAE